MKKLVKENQSCENATADFINNNIRFDLVTDGVAEGQVVYCPNLWEGIDKDVTGNGMVLINDYAISMLHGLDPYKDFEIV